MTKQEQIKTMTKDEIKKALECCISKKDGMCKHCPNYDYKHEDCMDSVKRYALNLITEQDKEIKQLKAEYKQLNTNAEILARGVRDLNHENYELTEKLKQAQIDVLKELKTRHDYAIKNMGYPWDISQQIDELIKEIENNNIR